MLRVHALQTGTVSVKTTHRQMRGLEALRFPRILLDSTWTEPLPIRVWVVEHEEGILVVDTGEMARASNPSTFAGPDGWFYRKNLRFRVEPNEEVGPQLQRLGISPKDVRWVVLTHLHSDHTDGLSYFPNTEIFVSAEEFAHPFGTYKPLWPSWFAPKLTPEAAIPFTAFPMGFPLTHAEDVFIVPTPGHSSGHQSVVVRDNDHLLFFAGDVTFTQQQLQEEKIPGVTFDTGKIRATSARIRQLSHEIPTIYLPSHDPESPKRLAERIPLPLQTQE